MLPFPSNTKNEPPLLFTSPDRNTSRVFPTSSSSSGGSIGNGGGTDASSSVPATPHRVQVLMNNNNTTNKNSSNQGGGGLRGAVSGFLKLTHSGSSGLDTPTGHHHHSNNTINYCDQNRFSLVPAEQNLDRLKTKHKDMYYQYNLSSQDVVRIVGDETQFRKIQESLRNNHHACTDGVVKEICGLLLHERKQELEQLQQMEIAEKQKERNQELQSQRKYQIAKELAEARIKAQQALQLMNDDDDDEEHTEDEEEDEQQRPSGASSASPTSVTAMLQVENAAELGKFKPGLEVEEDDSEDGDIQEVWEA